MDTLWNRTRHAFEKILEEGEKAAEKMVGSLEEMSDAAKTRLEKARLERALFKHYAELGSAVHEFAQAAKNGAGAEPTAMLDDPKVRELLEQVTTLDHDLKKAESQLGGD